MWNSRRIDRKETLPAVYAGTVTTGGEVIHVRTDMERRAPVVSVPYGMAVCVPQGEQVVLLPESGVCMGVINAPGGLQPGEVRLSSAGGAEILLKLDGTVVINGQVFPKTEVTDHAGD